MTSPVKRSIALLCLGAVLLAAMSLAQRRDGGARDGATSIEIEKSLDPDVN